MLRLPPVNPYVPTDFSLRTGSGEEEADRARADELAASLGLAVVLATPPTLVVEQPGGTDLRSRSI